MSNNDTATTTNNNTNTIHIDLTDGSPLAPDDPRVLAARGVQLIRAILARVTDDAGADPTPCDEWNVLELSRHAVSVMDRAAAAPSGVDIMAMPRLADVDVAGLDDAATESARRLHAAWTDDSALELSFSMPWGDMNGAQLLATYANELLVHSWDLATALDLVVDWPERDAELFLRIAHSTVPGEVRGGFVPFGPVVGVHDGAPAIDRLVAWEGRDVAAWPTPTSPD